MNQTLQIDADERVDKSMGISEKTLDHYRPTGLDFAMSPQGRTWTMAVTERQSEATAGAGSRTVGLSEPTGPMDRPGHCAIYRLVCHAAAHSR